MTTTKFSSFTVICLSPINQMKTFQCHHPPIRTHIFYIHIVTFTRLHQVILIDILPGKTKNRLKSDLNQK